jgi:hypothetical protein
MLRSVGCDCDCDSGIIIIYFVIPLNWNNVMYVDVADIVNHDFVVVNLNCILQLWGW